MNALTEGTALYLVDRTRVLERELEEIATDAASAFSTAPTFDGTKDCVKLTYDGGTIRDAGHTVDVAVGGCDGGSVDQTYRFHVISSSLDENAYFEGWYHLKLSANVEFNAQRVLTTGERVTWVGSFPLEHTYDIWNRGHLSVELTQSMVRVSTLGADADARIAASIGTGEIGISGEVVRTFYGRFSGIPSLSSTFDLAAKDGVSGASLELRTEGDFTRIGDSYPATGTLSLFADGSDPVQASYSNPGSAIYPIFGTAWRIATSNAPTTTAAPWPVGQSGTCSRVPLWR